MTTLHGSDFAAIHARNDRLPAAQAMQQRILQASQAMTGRLREIKSSEGADALDSARLEYVKLRNDMHVMQGSRELSFGQRRALKRARLQLEEAYRHARSVIDTEKAKQLLRKTHEWVADVKKADLAKGETTFFDIHTWVEDTTQTIRALFDYGRITKHMRNELAGAAKLIRTETRAKYSEYGIKRPYIPRAESILQKTFNMEDYVITSMLTLGFLGSGGYALYTALEHASAFALSAGPLFLTFVAATAIYYIGIRHYVLRAIRESQNPKGELYA